MADDPARRDPPYVLAAGGLLERAGAQGTEIAVVHRKRYEDADGRRGDYVLPKGKVEAGEDLEQTALREVKEETGCTARIEGPSFACEYVAAGVPKVVQFFRMRCVEEEAVADTSEVAEVLWLGPRQANARLTYEAERDVVRRAYPEAFGTGDDQ